MHSISAVLSIYLFCRCEFFTSCVKSIPPQKKKKKKQDQCYACHPVFCFAPTTMPTNFPEHKKHLEDPDVKSNIYFDHGVCSLYFMHSTSTLSETNISPKIEDWKIMCFPVWRGFLVGTMVVSGKASKQNGCLGVLDLGPQKSQQKLLPT